MYKIIELHNILRRNLFFSGGGRRRVRRDSQQPEHHAAENWNNTGISSTSSQWLSFTTISPTLNNDDVNITMHCQSYWFSCRGRCTHKRELGGTEERLQCFCDSSCELFHDCCADFDQFCSSGTLTQEAENPDYEHWKCIESDLLTEALGVWMIASCPANWTLEEDIDERCSSSFRSLSYDNHKDNLPVIDHTGNTYKNRYCAQCHGLNLDDLTLYNLLFHCHVPVPSNYQSNGILQFLFAFCDKAYWKSPEGAARRYCYQLTDGCPECFPPTKTQQKCLAGSLRVVYVNDTGMQQNFINPYCAFINNAKHIGCGPGSSKPQSDGGGNPLKAPKPFSLVMDVDFFDEKTGKESSSVRMHKVSCLEDNVYDFHLQVCRPGIAPTKLNSGHQELLSVSLWIRCNISSFWIPLVTEIDFKEAVVKKLNISETLFSVVSIGNPFGPVSTVLLNINIYPYTQKKLSMKTVQTTLSCLSINLNNVSFTVFKVAVKHFDCASVVNYSRYEYAVENKVVKIRNTGEMIQEANYYTNETEWINGSLVPVGTLTVCKQEQINCSGILIGLNESEYVILTNGSLYRNISREVFDSERILSISDTTWVCVHFSSTYELARNTTENNIVLVLLTYIGLSLSIVSFVAVLVTYALFKELRTLPGTNLMNLSLAHLLADLLYLATGYDNAKVACTVIAILLHYFFLVSLTWMSIMGLETWLVFSKIRIQHRNRKKRGKCLNLLGRTTLGWLPAFVFVVVCIALDQSNEVAFHYGGIKGCWINNAIANMFFFVVPVTLSISLNTVLFGLTVRAIRNTTKQTQRVTHQTPHRKTAVVFLKIFILTGFTWTFGILKIAVSEYFEYPFIIFTTLQRLFVMLAFVFTTRVKRMYYALLCIGKNTADGRERTLRTKRELVPPVVLLKHFEKKE